MSSRRFKIKNCCENCRYATNYTGYDDFVCGHCGSMLRAERFDCEYFKPLSSAEHKAEEETLKKDIISSAIEELKYDCNELGKAIPCDTSWGCSFENAYGMAIQALKKQIPKRPIECFNGNEWICECPVCKGITDTPNEVEIECIQYCGWCGQKLDWSEE